MRRFKRFRKKKFKFQISCNGVRYIVFRSLQFLSLSIGIYLFFFPSFFCCFVFFHFMEEKREWSNVHVIHVFLYNKSLSSMHYYMGEVTEFFCAIQTFQGPWTFQNPPPPLRQEDRYDNFAQLYARVRSKYCILVNYDEEE